MKRVTNKGLEGQGGIGNNLIKLMFVIINVFHILLSDLHVNPNR